MFRLKNTLSYLLLFVSCSLSLLLLLRFDSAGAVFAHQEETLAPQQSQSLYRRR